MVITRFLRATLMIAQLRVIMSIAGFVADSMVVTRFVRVALITTWLATSHTGDFSVFDGYYDFY